MPILSEARCPQCRSEIQFAPYELTGKIRCAECGTEFTPRVQKHRSGACLRNASGAFIETAKPAAPRDERMLYAQNMKLNSLQDLYVHGLKDLYSAETQLVEALPKMAEAATNEELKAGFEEHLEQTKGHVLRLEEIAESCGCNLGGHKCQAMEGLIEEGSELISEDAEDSVRDAGLIGSAQRVEH